MRRHLAAVVAAVMILIPPVGAPADTIEVNPGESIQAAIGAAVIDPNVDRVFVNCGVYYERVTMADQVTLEGAGSHCAVIDGGGDPNSPGSVVTIQNVGPTTRLEGFTIRNGISGLGGGVFIESSEVVVTRNVIEGNSAIDMGMGTFTGYGGGIHITTDLAAAGQQLVGTAAPTITRNTIRGNSADNSGGGIEVYFDDGSTISNNLILDNTAVQLGGGIDVFFSFPEITNNTIARNCVQPSMGTACASGGGGIALTQSGVSDIANNLIAWNEAAMGGGGVDQALSEVNYTSNDAFQNVPVNYVLTDPNMDVVPDPTFGNGNISTDPLLENPAIDDFHPRIDSPLLEAASNALSPADDHHGCPRPLDSDSDGGLDADIGAFEYDGLRQLQFAIDTTSLSWEDSPIRNPIYNLYRGDLGTLLTTWTYIQDPMTVAGAAQQCGLTSASASDFDAPAASQTFFYLVVIDKVAETTLGCDSLGNERPFTPDRCP